MDQAALLERAAEHQWQLKPVPWCDSGYWINREDESVPLGNTAEHLSGALYIQEASSMLPVTALFHHWSPAEQATVLDAAAAPGSKTTQIAAELDNKGLLVANEFSASRIKGLYSNLQRCGIANVALTHFDARVFGRWLPESFDAILLDAPCSGEGTVRKDQDAMKNWSASSVTDIANTQKDLIESAFYALKPGGILIYSTCTLNPEENQQVCYHLKDKYNEGVSFLDLGDLFDGAEKARTSEGFLHIWPQIYDSEGFFVAAIRKEQTAKPEPVKKRLGRFPFSFLKNKETEHFLAYLTGQFGIDSLPGKLFARDNEIWLFPEEVVPLIGEIKFDRIGIKVADSFTKGPKKGYRLTHEWTIAFGDLAESNRVSVNAEQAKEYYMGRDIRPEGNGKGEAIVCYRDHPIGLAKWVGPKLKNSLPRELVRDSNLFDI